MGIFCEILIHKPPTGAHRPGHAVTGLVRYAVDVPTECKDITLCLKGIGKCHWTETERVNDEDKTTHYSGTEVYMDSFLRLLDKKETELENSITIPTGTYEKEFEFVLPTNIPPSYRDHMSNITYYLNLKFVRRGLFKSNKKFHAEIPVQSYFDVEETGDPVVFGLQKTLFKIFSRKKHVINLKAEIASSFIEPGDDINLTYVVTNDTNVQIKTVKTELACRMTYTASCGKQYTYGEIVPGCVVESPNVPMEAIANLNSVIKTSPSIYSIQNSKVINRKYKILVTITLPLPYVNSSAEIPIFVCMGKNDAIVETDDKPPSYWEVMSEENKQKE